MKAVAIPSTQRTTDAVVLLAMSPTEALALRNALEFAGINAPGEWAYFGAVSGRALQAALGQLSDACDVLVHRGDL